ncbi:MULTISPECIES: hypothetical protein [unclassified Devosia]|uniref:DUF6894 family protein n=1 Tax=unclassified Devosia TaxID=196773 RepID=UPI000FDB8863|nr:MULTISPECIES: hypothetical protein [unclassified Devosia]
MPRFYFDMMANGDLSLDHTGVELQDLPAAREEALRTAMEVAAELIPEQGPLRLVFAVSNEAYRLMLRVIVEFEAAPANFLGDHMQWRALLADGGGALSRPY